jgi:hypothetical protein
LARTGYIFAFTFPADRGIEADEKPEAAINEPS